MFAFKVCVSTITVIVMALILLASVGADKQGRNISTTILIVFALCLLAMWG